LGSWGDDIGLLYLVLLNAAVGIAAWRLARRRSADALDAAGDAFLIFYFVQYLSVCVTGIAGAMHALTIGLVALLASAVIALGSWRIRPREGDFNARDLREGASDAATRAHAATTTAAATATAAATMTAAAGSATDHATDASYDRGGRTASSSPSSSPPSTTTASSSPPSTTSPSPPSTTASSASTSSSPSP
jgi:hypothetical protein